MKTHKLKWIDHVMDKHEKTLINYAYGLCRNIEMAKDVTQEALIKLCHQDESKISTYVLPWLLRVCRNLVYDKLKKEKKMTFVENEIIENKSDGNLIPSHALEKIETQNELQHWIDRLPKNQKEVLDLKFRAELSYKQISEVTGLSVSNVGFLIHSAVRSIRNNINNEDNKISSKGGAQ